MTNIKSEKKTVRIALDAMGGDFAPINEVQGAIQVFDNNYQSQDIEIVLVGNEKKIQDALSQFDISKLKYSIVHTEEVITMHDEPTAAIKKKKNSSLYKGIELCSQGFVDAFVSAGNTGAVLSTSTVLLGRMKGVSRPTIGSFFPSEKTYPTFVMDVGANSVCKAKFLYEFAVMGSIHVTNMIGIENPKVGLLNIGEETSKGTDVIHETFQLLSESHLNFIGNIEGNDILKGTADVVICDGFTGNIILKFAESFPGFFRSKVISFSKKSKFNLLATALMKPFLKKVFMEFDYQEYGGVPLLGVNGVVIIGHGKSSAKAIKHMILKAIDMVNKDVNLKIETALTSQNVTEIKIME